MPITPGAILFNSRFVQQLSLYPLEAISRYNVVQTGPNNHAGGAILGATHFLLFEPPTNHVAPQVRNRITQP